MTKKVNNKENPRVLIEGVPVWCAYDELVDTGKLKPHPKNPNQHTDEQIRILAKIIKQNGWRETITVSTSSGYITKGHGRLQAAKLMGAEQVPVEYQNYQTEKAELEDLVADNQIAEMSWIDEDLLNDIFEEFNILEIDLDIELLGFDKFPEPKNRSWGDMDHSEQDKRFEKGKSDEINLSFICTKKEYKEILKKLNIKTQKQIIPAEVLLNVIRG